MGAWRRIRHAIPRRVYADNHHSLIRAAGGSRQEDRVDR